jgi:Tfp pilus assembly PilM family ATPase
MRDALRLNGMALLGQDVRQMVLDCDVIETAGAAGGFGVEDSSRAKFLVAGLSRKRVDALGASFAEIKAGLKTIQLAPVAAFNAFEFAQEQTFNNDAFLILDVGHQSSTVIVGVKRSVVLVRTIEYGGNMLFQSLMDAGAHSPRAAMEVLEQGDDLLVEAARISLATLTREISSSIGFFEGRCEENISRVYISGGLAQSRAVIQTLAEELHLPCMAWNPFERCEIALPEAARAAFRNDMVNLHVACGVAVEMLKGN